jgi:hypothetical protein
MTYKTSSKKCDHINTAQREHVNSVIKGIIATWKQKDLIASQKFEEKQLEKCEVI